MYYKIIHLPKEQWEGHILTMDYVTSQYYDVIIESSQSGFAVAIEKKTFDSPVQHLSEECDFPDKLYQDFVEDACAWGVIEDGNLIAAIETSPEKWSNRLRIWEIWIAEGYRKQGIGHALMEVAREQAILERRRAIILETQSCNVNAVDFYLHEGFTLIGLDTCCYHNNDLQRKEVRMEMGWFPPKSKKLLRSEVEIRMEKPEDWYVTEQITRAAFWNRHAQGCDEHYLVYKLREDKDYLPTISRIACKDGEVIGCIMYSKAYIMDGDTRHDLITFGPLCVSPDWYGCGVGEMLLKETMELAAAEGYPGIVIFGEPDYYPRVGFQTCDHFDITTKEGKNFNAFMGIELIEGGMKDIKGKFYEAEVFENLPADKVEQYDRHFEPREKRYFPEQWN